MLLKQFHPFAVAECVVEFGRTFDVGEDDDDVAVGSQPCKIGALDPRPACKVLDRVAHGGTDALLDQRVGRLPDGPDRDGRKPARPATTRLVLAAALEFASRSLQLVARDDQKDGQRDESGEFDAGDHPDDDWGQCAFAAAADVITGPVWLLLGMIQLKWS